MSLSNKYLFPIKNLTFLDFFKAWRHNIFDFLILISIYYQSNLFFRKASLLTDYWQWMNFVFCICCFVEVQDQNRQLREALEKETSKPVQGDMGVSHEMLDFKKMFAETKVQHINIRITVLRMFIFILGGKCLPKNWITYCLACRRWIFPACSSFKDNW